MFFNRDWIKQSFGLAHPIDIRSISKPSSLKTMLEGVEVLSAGFDFVRVDFYEVNGKAIFGEMTFYPGSGTERFDPPEWDHMFGEMWA